MIKMMKLTGNILYDVVHKAMQDVHISLTNNNTKAIMVWHDTIKDKDYWSSLAPYQIVNRIPNINLICRKAHCVRLIHRMSCIFPRLYSFLPLSYILPLQMSEFIREVEKQNKKFIIKPDNGSLGQGITILNPGDEYIPSKIFSISQEYIESFLINETKFDCRVFAVVASITPLRIYVYHDGIARFCSKKNGIDSAYSQITNTSFNKHNRDADLNLITKNLLFVFEIIRRQRGINPKLIWAKIDALVVLTIMSDYSFLQKGEMEKCPSYGYPRCFQILGFDILLDNQLNPKLLEVNFRPSLSTIDIPMEMTVKKSMLVEVMKLFSSFSLIQKYISNENWDNDIWIWFLKKNKATFQSMLNNTYNNSKLVQVYPVDNETVQQIYDTVLYYAERMPTDRTSDNHLPVKIDVEMDHYPLSNIKFSDIGTKLYYSLINDKTYDRY